MRRWYPLAIAGRLVVHEPLEQLRVVLELGDPEWLEPRLPRQRRSEFATGPTRGVYSSDFSDAPSPCSTSSMIAIGAESPLRKPALTILV